MSVLASAVRAVPLRIGDAAVRAGPLLALLGLSLFLSSPAQAAAPCYSARPTPDPGVDGPRPCTLSECVDADNCTTFTPDALKPVCRTDCWDGSEPCGGQPSCTGGEPSYPVAVTFFDGRCTSMNLTGCKVCGANDAGTSAGCSGLDEGTCQNSFFTDPATKAKKSCSWSYSYSGGCGASNMVCGACVPEQGGEVCDRRDNNCNGQIDEGTLSCGTGECRNTVNMCVSGAPNACTPKPPGVERGPAACSDGKDNNCDPAGKIDCDDPDCRNDPTSGCVGTIAIVLTNSPTDPQDFEFGGSAPLGGFVLDDDGGADDAHSDIKEFPDVPVGPYSITERVPAGWALTEIECDGSPLSAEAVASKTATIELGQGETVTCTFKNTPTGTIIIALENSPKHQQDFKFGAAPAPLEPFTLDDDRRKSDADPDPDTEFSSQTVFSNIPIGTYQIAELLLDEPLRDKWNLYEIVCDDSPFPFGVGAKRDPELRTATVVLERDKTVTCTFKNEHAEDLTCVFKNIYRQHQCNLRADGTMISSCTTGSHFIQSTPGLNSSQRPVSVASCVMKNIVGTAGKELTVTADGACTHQRTPNDDLEFGDKDGVPNSTTLDCWEEERACDCPAGTSPFGNPCILDANADFAYSTILPIPIISQHLPPLLSLGGKATIKGCYKPEPGEVCRSQKGGYCFVPEPVPRFVPPPAPAGSWIDDFANRFWLSFPLAKESRDAGLRLTEAYEYLAAYYRVYTSNTPDTNFYDPNCTYPARNIGAWDCPKPDFWVPLIQVGELELKDLPEGLAALPEWLRNISVPNLSIAKRGGIAQRYCCVDPVSQDWRKRISLKDRLKKPLDFSLAALNGKLDCSDLAVGSSVSEVKVSYQGTAYPATFPAMLASGGYRSAASCAGSPYTVDDPSGRVEEFVDPNPFSIEPVKCSFFIPIGADQVPVGALRCEMEGGAQLNLADNQGCYAEEDGPSPNTKECVIHDYLNLVGTEFNVKWVKTHPDWECWQTNAVDPNTRIADAGIRLDDDDPKNNVFKFQCGFKDVPLEKKEETVKCEINNVPTVPFTTWGDFQGSRRVERARLDLAPDLSYSITPCYSRPKENACLAATFPDDKSIEDAYKRLKDPGEIKALAEAIGNVHQRLKFLEQYLPVKIKYTGSVKPFSTVQSVECSVKVSGLKGDKLTWSSGNSAGELEAIKLLKPAMFDYEKENRPSPLLNALGFVIEKTNLTWSKTVALAYSNLMSIAANSCVTKEPYESKFDGWPETAKFSCEPVPRATKHIDCTFKNPPSDKWMTCQEGLMGQYGPPNRQTNVASFKTNFDAIVPAEDLMQLVQKSIDYFIPEGIDVAGYKFEWDKILGAASAARQYYHDLAKFVESYVDLPAIPEDIEKLAARVEVSIHGLPVTAPGCTDVVQAVTLSTTTEALTFDCDKATIVCDFVGPIPGIMTWDPTCFAKDRACTPSDKSGKCAFELSNLKDVASVTVVAPGCSPTEVEVPLRDGQADVAKFGCPLTKPPAHLLKVEYRSPAVIGNGPELIFSSVSGDTSAGVLPLGEPLPWGSPDADAVRDHQGAQNLTPASGLYRLGPSDTTFDPPATIKFRYDPAALASRGVDPNTVAIHDVTMSGGEVVSSKIVGGTNDASAHTVTAQLTSFHTVFGLFAESPPAVSVTGRMAVGGGVGAFPHVKTAGGSAVGGDVRSQHAAGETGAAVSSDAVKASQAGFLRLLDWFKPSITAAVSPEPNSNGWHKTDVTVSFECSDFGWGLDDGACPEDVVLTQEGSELFVERSVTDRAGRTTPIKVGPIRIDKSAPLVSADARLPDGGAYTPGTWSNQDVVVSFGCDADISGVESLTPPVTFYDDAADHSAAGTCVDKAGNEAKALVEPIQIDKTPPAITAGAKTADGVEYASDTWTNQDVTVTFACDAAISGQASLTSPVTLSTEGDGQSASGTCVDNAGNSASTIFEPARIDKSSPTITASAKTADGVEYASGTWTNQDVTVSFACDAAISGQASLTPPIPLTAEGDDQSAPGTCADNAGNSDSTSFTPVRIDKSSPTTAASLSGTLSADETRYLTPVDMTLGASDNLSLVEQTLYRLDGGDLQVYGGSFPVTAVGSHTIEFYSKDFAGNVEAVQSASFFINAAPVASIDGGSRTVMVGALVAFDGRASTDTDGAIAAYDWDFGDGSSATFSTATHRFAPMGVYAVTLTVTDDHGATGSASVNVTVQSASDAVKGLVTFIEDLDPPLDNGAETSIVNQLELAIDRLEDGSTDQAIKKLEDFIKGVEAHRTAGQISDDLAAYLTALANVMIEALQNSGGGGGAAGAAALRPKTGSFSLGEVYAFPNPAKAGAPPVLHVEAGWADSVEIRVYDVTGGLVQEAVLRGPPKVVDDGQGPQFAYEHELDASRLGSGVYIFAVQARKAGHADLKAQGKLALIK